VTLERSISSTSCRRRFRIFDFQPRLWWTGRIRRVEFLWNSTCLGPRHLGCQTRRGEQTTTVAAQRSSDFIENLQSYSEM